jgi:DNA-binding CsgD family transcriptional regulator
MEKLLLNLHGTSDIAAFWKAAQDLINTALPNCRLGITLQSNTPLTMANDWTCQIPAVVFGAAGFKTWIDNHSGVKLARGSDVFANRPSLMRSAIYRRYMLPHKCAHAAMLFFWNRNNIVCIMTIMRAERYGNFDAEENDSLHRLYPHFQISLDRLASREREHTARSAMQKLIGRLPLATMVLRWNLQMVYQNGAARDFCNVWNNGRELARVLKASTVVPETILKGCRSLKSRWKKSETEAPADRHATPQSVRSSRFPDLRVLIQLVQPNSIGIGHPHFLIECEDRQSGDRPETRTQLTQLARLTPRERELTRLLCDGQSNQEIADAAKLSLAMVKKHFHSIFRKLELNSRTQLIALMR